MSHLNDELRVMIRNGLDRKLSLKEIAACIGKDRTTVLREILRHRSGMGEPSCPLLAAPPHVCNGCGSLHRCRLDKLLYIPDKAQSEYRQTLHSSREGFNLSQEELDHISDMVRDGVAMGQSVHHIMVARASEFRVCEKSVYKMINAGVLDTQRHHLREAPCRRLRPRKSKAVQHKVERKCREGRGMDDYRAFLDANPGAGVVEMDSVEGRRGGKVLLTLNIDSCGLMLAFLRDRNDAKSVQDVFDALEERLGGETFRRIFGAVLTDNGSEFSNPSALETGADGTPRTRVFYCDPYSAWQKPCVENNHRNLRKIFEKGVSLDGLTQDTVDVAVSHVNSLIRKGYGDQSAAERFRRAFGAEALAALRVREIPANEVCLRPGLAGLKA